MDFDFTNPGLTEAEVKELLANKRRLVEAGRYRMKVNSITSREMGDTGRYKASVFLSHVEEGKGGYQGVELDLFRQKDNPARNTEVSQKFLTILGKALGLSTAELATITWGWDKDAAKDDFGRIPAAIAVMKNGAYTPISLEGVEIEAVVDIEEFTKRDGSTGQKNIVKSISLVS